MNTATRVIIAAWALAGLGACDHFLSGPGIDEDPNFPVGATAEQIFIGVQARGFLQMQGQFARTASIWTQQIAGINNQQRTYGSRYEQEEQDINTQFNGIYTAGGLVDIRRLRDLALEAGDPRLTGIAMVWEAFTMGTYASLFGDLPYREAAIPDIPAPVLDPQQQIYDDVQALLTGAIQHLEGAPGTPGFAVDLVYGGDTDRWIAAAHTLKARFYLHVAPRVGAAAYQDALQHAELGINEPPASPAQAIHGQAPGDFRAWHGGTLDDGNVWAQFVEARADLVANQRMVSILEQRADPRLTAYFAPVDGAVRGADQFGVGGDPEPWSPLSPGRVFREFRQPFITWAETQLIKAEAAFQLGSQETARTHLNGVRQAVGMAALEGPVTLEDIMVEKWIVQFQNIDVYSDWRRTCYPRLIPGGPEQDAAGRPVPAARVPGRYVYGQTERQQNPNFADLAPSQQPADNWNFEPVAPCPAGNTGGERYPAGL